MATFKVGQRVKAVRALGIANVVGINAEGVINEPLDQYTISPGLRYGVLWDNGEESYSRPESLVPLADPEAEQFIESIKKLKPYEEPTVKQPEPKRLDVATFDGGVIWLTERGAIMYKNGKWVRL